jgi:hypothetical protein
LVRTGPGGRTSNALHVPNIVAPDVGLAYHSMHVLIGKIPQCIGRGISVGVHSTCRRGSSNDTGPPVGGTFRLTPSVGISTPSRRERRRSIESSAASTSGFRSLRETQKSWIRLPTSSRGAVHFPSGALLRSRRRQNAGAPSTRECPSFRRRRGRR